MCVCVCVCVCVGGGGCIHQFPRDLRRWESSTDFLLLGREREDARMGMAGEGTGVERTVSYPDCSSYTLLIRGSLLLRI